MKKQVNQTAAELDDESSFKLQANNHLYYCALPPLENHEP